MEMITVRIKKGVKPYGGRRFQAEAVYFSGEDPQAGQLSYYSVLVGVNRLGQVPGGELRTGTWYNYDPDEVEVLSDTEDSRITKMLKEGRHA